MVEKVDKILGGEEAFARRVALGVLVTTPQSVFHTLIPFMFIFDFLRRGTVMRRYTSHFMFPRKLAVRAALDILEGDGKTRRLSDIEPEVETWLNTLKIYSSAVQRKQMEVVERLVENYLKLLAAEGETYHALIKTAYDNRQNYEAYLRRLASVEEELDKAIIETLGDTENLRQKIEAEREQVKRLSDKMVEEIFRQRM
jgi:hypothetical protein